jgi:hypothetical protein
MLRIVVVVVVIAGVLIGGRAWARSQDYVKVGSKTSFPGSVPYRDGERVSYGLSIRNDGPLAIKVTEVEKPQAPNESLFMFRPVAVRMADREGAGGTSNTPFRPFTLKKGHERYVEVTGRLGDCEHYAPGSGEFIRVQPVTFKVLGQTLTQNVRLPGTVEIRYSRATKCPR